MLTRTLAIKHVEDLDAGSLIYHPALGDGLLCISARYDGQLGRATFIVPLSGQASSPYALQTLSVDHVGGRTVLVEGARAEVDLSSVTSSYEAVAHAANDGTYVRLRPERPNMFTQQCLRLEDGIIRSSPPTDAVGFARWRIVLEDDPSEELWNSDSLINSNDKGALGDK